MVSIERAKIMGINENLEFLNKQHCIAVYNVLISCQAMTEDADPQL